MIIQFRFEIIFIYRLETREKKTKNLKNLPANKISYSEEHRYSNRNPFRVAFVCTCRKKKRKKLTVKLNSHQ